MSKFELKLPKMGESVAEATITSWLKEVGDPIELDDPVVEIATDKVDSEVPSEVEGVLVEKLFDVDDVVKVGEVFAIIEVKGEQGQEQESQEKEEEVKEVPKEIMDEIPTVEKVKSEQNKEEEAISVLSSRSGRFYSPLVRNIARTEGIGMEELESIVGSGRDKRVTKNDILAYIENRNKQEETPVKPKEESKNVSIPKPAISVGKGDEVIEMTRMGKLIAKHMIASKQISAHVQSFVEVDVTNVVRWRNRVKDEFFKREGEKITFTPIFMYAVTKALKDYPMMNISVDGDKVIKHNYVNLGMATALGDGNLIVPVIKGADQLNLIGMTRTVNELALKARSGKLQPDDIQGGTYTVTNVGSFGSIAGTPIINQPEVGILALGTIRKVPAVIETPEGDFIGIRYKMIITHSYDHRVVNGALGSLFAKKVCDYLEAWDVNADF